MMCTYVTCHLSYEQLCAQQELSCFNMYNMMLHEWHCNITKTLIYIIIHDVCVHITPNDIKHQMTLTKVTLITKFVTCHSCVHDNNTMYISWLLCTSYAWMNNIENKWKLTIIYMYMYQFNNILKVQQSTSWFLM